MKTGVSEWSDGVAALVVDALLDADLIKSEDLEAAVRITSEEISVRLALGDYPPADQDSN